jgi:transketolase N-terminal domain/subunit
MRPGTASRHNTSWLSSTVTSLPSTSSTTEANSKLPGHPELGLTPGVKFSSGTLGHMWPLVNGVAMGNKGKTVFCLGSDGSQQEGDDAEAARLAAAQGLNVKLFIDDNDVTIA